MSEQNVQELYSIIGSQQVQIMRLRARVVELMREVERLEGELEVDDFGEED